MRTVSHGIGERYEHETLLVRRGPRSGLPTVIAVHSTALGPALGGCRMWSYATLEGAVADALRLSRAMTLKAAVARLPLGGGKAVIRLPAGVERDLRQIRCRDRLAVCIQSNGAGRGLQPQAAESRHEPAFLT